MLLHADALKLGPPGWDALLKRAIVDYLMASRLEDAERLVAECLEKSPQSHEVLFYLGDSQRVLMDYEGARRTLERLLATRPDHLQGTLALGHVNARLGRPAEAIALLELYLAKGEGPPELRSMAVVEWARALKRLGRKQEAADKLCALLESEPYHTVALSEAAQVFAMLGQAEVAKGIRAAHAWLFERGHQLSVEDESKVYSTGPTSRADAARLALQAADRREVLAAARQLSQLLAVEPGDAIHAAALARLWLRVFRCHDATGVSRAARSHGARSADLLRIEAEAWSEVGNDDAARLLFIEASKVLAEPGALRGDEAAFVVDTHVRGALLALESKETGGMQAARDCLARAEAAAPEDWRVAYGKARVEIAAGRAREASSHLEQAAERSRLGGGRVPAEVRRWSGVVSGVTGDLSSAAREILALVKENPGELENFKAFEQAFASQRGDPQVVQVLDLKRKLEERLAARRRAVEAVADSPLGSCAASCLALGKLLAAEGARERALDAFFLAAELDDSLNEALSRAADLLTLPQERFVRLKALRAVLERSPGDPVVLEGLIRAYLTLGARLDEAEALALRLQGIRPAPASEQLLRSVRDLRAQRRP